MFRHLVRWLVRLFFFALIAGVVGFVITRLMGGEDEDFEDFDDIESSFEFNETPVEIDVSGPATSGTSTMDIESPTSSDDTISASESSEGSNNGSSDENTGGPRLIDIKGIGPSYEARLKAMGITSMSDLLGADSEQIVESANVIGGVAEVDDWKEQARAMTTDEQA